MSFTRQDWAVAFLRAVGNAQPSQQVVDWVIGWTVHETCTNCEQDCAFNLLNTHQGGWPKCSGDNGAVSAFPDISTGAQVNASVLSQGFSGYSALRQALAANDIQSLTNGSTSQGLATWGTHSAANDPAGLVATGAAHRNDTFGYGSGSGSGSTNAQVATGNVSTSGCPDCSQYNPLDPKQTALWGACVSISLTCSGAGVKQTIDATTAFFQLLAPWLSNPVRILKMVMGLSGLAIAVLVIFWPQAESTVVTAGKALAVA